VGRYVSFIGDGPGKDDVSDTGRGKKAVIFLSGMLTCLLLYTPMIAGLVPIMWLTPATP
jgi:hypothetical protein